MAYHLDAMKNVQALVVFMFVERIKIISKSTGKESCILGAVSLAIMMKSREQLLEV